MQRKGRFAHQKRELAAGSRWVLSSTGDALHLAAISLSEIKLIFAGPIFLAQCYLPSFLRSSLVHPSHNFPTPSSFPIFLSFYLSIWFLSSYLIFYLSFVFNSLRVFLSAAPGEPFPRTIIVDICRSRLDTGNVLAMKLGENK